MGQCTTIKGRELVLCHFKKDRPHRKIAEIVCLSNPNVQNIISRFVHENKVENEVSKTPNKVFNKADQYTLSEK